MQVEFSRGHKVNNVIFIGFMYPVYSMVESKVITNMCLNYVTLSLSLFQCEDLQGLLLCPMAA